MSPLAVRILAQGGLDLARMGDGDMSPVSSRDSSAE
jgi:hypothetical protein